MAVPSTATATKLTELLIRKKATERRAIRSAGMPPPAEDPGAERQPAGAAGRDDRAHRQLGDPDLQLVRHDIRSQNTGPNIST